MKRAILVVPVAVAVLAVVAGLAVYAVRASADDTDYSGAMQMSGGTQMTASGAGDPYPLTTCPVSGEDLGGMGDPVVYDYDGREIRFCCSGCIKKFEANPQKYIGEIDAKIIAMEKPYYPLTTCMVTGEKLGGEMGDPVDYVYNNRLIRFCCKGCIKDFNADPAKYMSKLDQAVIDAQLPDYPLTTCPVSGEELGGDMGKPIDFVFANRLVRFCCPNCIKDFKADPAKYRSKLDAAS
jgi:YHS domain-containing protein